MKVEVCVKIYLDDHSFGDSEKIKQMKIDQVVKNFSGKNLIRELGSVPVGRDVLTPKFCAISAKEVF